MTMVVRHFDLTNTTGAAVLPGGATIEKGQDYATQEITVTIAAADVGGGAGQTQEAAGMIFAEVYGSLIKRVISESVVRTAGGFDYFFQGSDIVTKKIGFKIVNTDGKSTLRLIDAASGGAGRLAAGDKVVVIVELGNS